jgi:hypothetical protein
MVPALLAEADKVMRTTARLSSTLRRLLDARAAADRIRLASVLRDIRQAAMRLGEAPSDASIQLEVDAEIDLASPMARTFWSPAQTFTDQAATQHEFDADHVMQMAAAFARLQRLDFRKMRSKIREATFEGRNLPMTELVEKYPIQAGIVELLGYLQIAHDDGHRIDTSRSDKIVVHDSRANLPMVVSIPHVTFVPRASSQNYAKKPR